MSNRLRSLIPTLLLSVLFAGGTAYLSKGMVLSWGTGLDNDMTMLRDQFSLFAEGVYPHRRVAEAAGVAGVQLFSIYPPYAYPLMGPFFWPENLEAARAIHQALTFAALGFLMWYGARRLAFAGRSYALLGAAIPFAFSGNCSAITSGQFTIIVVALLLAQLLLLRRGFPVLAGLCWACAMFKPQIALPFALLFLVKPRWRGLFSGGAILLVLTGLALWWTQVDPRILWTQGVASHRLKFMETTGYGAGLWVGAWGVNARLATVLGLGVMTAGASLFLLPRVRALFTLESTASVAAVLSIALFYHRQYDNIVMMFLLLPLAAAALRRRTIPLFLMSALLALAVYIPVDIAGGHPFLAALLNWFIFTIPIAACTMLLLSTPQDRSKQNTNKS